MFLIQKIPKNDVSNESSDELFEFPPMTENEDYSTHESLLDPETGLTEIGEMKATVSSEELLYRKWKFLKEDEQIQNKFRKLVLPDEKQVPMISGDTIKNIEVHPVSKDGAELDVFFNYISKEKRKKTKVDICLPAHTHSFDNSFNFRKSVIVKRNDYEVEENFREEEIMKIFLNIKEIENMYLSEEGTLGSLCGNSALFPKSFISSPHF